MSALRHQLLDDGRVLVSAISGTAHQIHVTPAEAKRFAWAVLSDLDPDEAHEAGYEPPRRDVVASDRDRAPWGSQIQSIMEFLAGGEANTREIASAIETTRGHAAVQMSKLLKRQMVRRVRGGIAGDPTVWGLGPVTLEQWRLANDARGVTIRVIA